MKDKDITMKIKMGSKSFFGIRDLADGKRIDETQIIPLCDFVDERYDCADFRAVVLLKTLYAYSDLLSKNTTERIKKTLLDFKYWMDEPGDDSLCYWSENHQLIFHTCEYMAGNLFKDEIFSNSGMTGIEHIEKARWRILQWFEHKWKYGFIEWHSNTYYEEDIAPLALLIDHAPEKTIREKAKIIMDLLILDIAMFSYDGFLSTSSGRCYEAQKKDGTNQDTRDIYEHVFGDGNHCFDYKRLSSVFLLCKDYEVPAVIREIARDKGPAVIKDSTGLDLSELKDELDMKNKDTGGAFMWQMEGFTNPETIELTMDMFNEYKMYSNDFLKDLKKVNIGVLRKLGLLPLIVRILNPSTQGVAIQRNNGYTYKTKNYMLSTSMRHHPGEFGDQQHIWHAVMPGNIHIFTTHPGAPFFDDNARNFSPSYWVGNGIMPDSVQHGNIHMSIYKTDQRKGFLERERPQFTHAFFPALRFDEVIKKDKCVFGRKGKSYIALLSTGEMEFKGDDEIIQRGTKTAWVCHLSSQDESETFEKFMVEVDAMKIIFNGRKLSYGNISLEFKGEFKSNDVLISTKYKRLETPYVDANRKTDELNVRFGEKSLLLNLEKTVRQQ